MNIILGIIIVMITLGLIIGLSIYQYKRFKTTPININIKNAGYSVYQEQITEQERIAKLKKYVPDYVNKDIYVDLKKDERTKKILQDYFYLLSMAIQTYFKNKEDILINLKKKEIYLPVLVFIKYEYDYSVYIRDIPTDVIDKMYRDTYGKIDCIEEAGAFLHKLSIAYVKNRKEYDDIIYHKFYNKKLDINTSATCPTATCHSIDSKSSGETVYGERLVMPLSLICEYKKNYIDTNPFSLLPLDVRRTKFLDVSIEMYKLAFENYSKNLMFYNNVIDKFNKNEDTSAILFENKFCEDMLLTLQFFLLYGDYVEEIPIEFSQGKLIENDLDLRLPKYKSFIDTLFTCIMICVVNNDAFEKYLNSIDCTTPVYYTYTTVTGPSITDIPKPGILPIIEQEAPLDRSLYYLTLTIDDRSRVILEDFVIILKNAVDAIVTNKVDFYKVYINITTGNEFLYMPKFIPVLKYAKFIKDNNQYMTEIDETLKTQAIDTLYPDFNSDSKFYIQGTHAQVFLILANSLYETEQNNVNKAILRLTLS
jgi:hypothetical protein